MNRKRLQFVSALALIATTAAACSSSKAPTTSPTTPKTNSDVSSTAAGVDPGKISLAFASAGDQVATYKVLADGVSADSAELGMKVKRYDNNLDGPTGLSVARLIVQSKPNIVIDWNISEAVSQSIAAVFKQANLKCISIEQAIDGCNNLEVSNIQLGIEEGDAIAAQARSRGWTSANTTIVLSALNAISVSVTDVVRYTYIELAKKLGGFKVVAPADINPSTTSIGGTNGLQVDCAGTIDAANTSMRNAMGNIPKGNNVILVGNSDDCALGAYQALKQGGFGSKIMVSSSEASAAGINGLITDPNWVCEGAEFIQSWGPYLLSMAVAKASGATVPATTEAPTVMLTKATVAKYYNPDGSIKLLPPLVDSNKYLAQYNVLQKLAKVEGLNS